MLILIFVYGDCSTTMIVRSVVLVVNCFAVTFALGSTIWTVFHPHLRYLSTIPSDMHYPVYMT